MSPITRTWLAFAAIGAGLIHLALVISSPLPLSVLLGVLGAAELVWGVMAFLRDRVAAPRVVLWAALVPVVGWGLTVVAAIVLEDTALAAALPVLPLAVASIFELFIASVVSFDRRRTPQDLAVERPTPGAVRYLGAVTIGALAVSLLTTPALAATEAGRYAQPHGEHSADVTPAETAPAPAPATIRLPDHSGH